MRHRDHRQHQTDGGKRVAGTGSPVLAAGPSSAQPRPRARTSASKPTAATGTITTAAQGVVKCATRLVMASTDHHADIDVDPQVVQR